MGARPQKFHQAWAAQGASPWIVSFPWEGYHLKFKKPPLLSSHYSMITASPNPTEIEILQEQFDSLTEKGTVELVLPSVGPGFFSRIFIVL